MTPATHKSHLDELVARLEEDAEDVAYEDFNTIGNDIREAAATIKRLKVACEAVLNSDMAMREEDEGEVSDTLELVRNTLEGRD